MSEIYYTKQEVANLFNRTKKTIDVWVREGKLQPYKLGDNKQSPVLFMKNEVDNLFKKYNKGE